MLRPRFGKAARICFANKARVIQIRTVHIVLNVESLDATRPYRAFAATYDLLSFVIRVGDTGMRRSPHGNAHSACGRGG